MHLHILGIGGTFMSALALLARDAGFYVTGSDASLYPPVSDLLQEKGIEWVEGYEDSSLALRADQVIIGNAIKRGMPVLEALLNASKKYISGPQWLAENILPPYRVLAVAGTHGKTTTTSLLAFILAEAGLQPGFLIGGIAPNFATSACLGKGKWFVIEADEYDSAYFDKRPKFMHYRPEISILNNLEFDHADIYPNLEAIEQQFHYFLKTIPSKGLVIKPEADEALNRVLAKGVYSLVETFSLESQSAWGAQLLNQDGSAFEVFYQQKKVAEVYWPLIGQFNVENGLAALAASFHAGVQPVVAAEALSRFTPPKRRLEEKGSHHKISLYDDFAHHPTAIQKTIHALRQSCRHQRILVVMEFASYTMRSGAHDEGLKNLFNAADAVYILQPPFAIHEYSANWTCSYGIFSNVQNIIEQVVRDAQAGDAIVVMSNRGFDNIHQRLLEAIASKNTQPLTS